MHAVCHTPLRFTTFHRSTELILQRLIGKSAKVWLSETKRLLEVYPFVRTVFILIAEKSQSMLRVTEYNQWTPLKHKHVNHIWNITGIQITSSGIPTYLVIGFIFAEGNGSGRTITFLWGSVTAWTLSLSGLILSEQQPGSGHLTGGRRWRRAAQDD